MKDAKTERKDLIAKLEGSGVQCYLHDTTASLRRLIVQLQAERFLARKKKAETMETREITDDCQLVCSLILECSKTGKTKEVKLKRPLSLAYIFYSYKIALQRRRENDSQLSAYLCKGICRLVY